MTPRSTGWRSSIGSPVASRQESGTGIGLYLVRALVEAHGGDVAVEDSMAFRGAHFVVSVPSAGIDTKPLEVRAEQAIA